MKSYSYFPGCSSSEGNAVSYDISIRAVCPAIGMELKEIEDWNCCGSTPYLSTNELEAVCVAARNLALAEKEGLDIVTPCSSCYTILKRVDTEMQKYPELKSKVKECLAAAGLEYNGGLKVRHLFEAIYTDIGLDNIKAKVVKPLTGLKAAAYYGCQLVRPECDFDDLNNPQTMEKLIAALGAEPVTFPMKDRCCGGALVIPELDLTMGLIDKVLQSAAANGAQCIITACPMCYTILDAYQDMVKQKYNRNYNLPILLFTQLIGVALGMSPAKLAIDKALVSADKVLAKFTGVAV